MAADGERNNKQAGENFELDHLIQVLGKWLQVEFSISSNSSNYTVIKMEHFACLPYRWPSGYKHTQSPTHNLRYAKTPPKNPSSCLWDQKLIMSCSVQAMGCELGRGGLGRSPYGKCCRGMACGLSPFACLAEHYIFHLGFFFPQR